MTSAISELALERATVIQSSPDRTDAIRATARLASCLKSEGVPRYLLDDVEAQPPKRTVSVEDLSLTEKALPGALKRAVIDYAIEFATVEEMATGGLLQESMGYRDEALELARQTLHVAHSYGIKVQDIFASLIDPSLASKEQVQVASR